VRLPYIGMAIVLFLLAVGLASISLKPQQAAAEVTRDFRPGDYANGFASNSIWRQKWLFAGALGIFTYVGAEVSIGSLLVNFMGLPSIAGLPAAVAANYLMIYWGGAMVGRFIGSAVLTRLSTGKLLGFSGLCSLSFVVLAVCTHGHLAMYALLAVGCCNSIMFPSIFTLSIQGLGPLTSKGSSLMIAAIVGGAIIPLATGRLADSIGLQPAFLLPAICYVYIAALGFAAWSRPAGAASTASNSH
jgi:FHS family L-fucose permease-like MFS transporter